MDGAQFSRIRHNLGKTQNQLSRLLCVSPKAVQSFEQGWRKVPVSAERQLLLLFALKRALNKQSSPCWEVKKCPSEWKNNCAAWEFQAGHFCWFINGTFCEGQAQESWKKKTEICQRCNFYTVSMRE